MTANHSTRRDAQLLTRRNCLNRLVSAAIPIAGGLVSGNSRWSRTANASDPATSPFEVRGTLGCGWNLFVRKGYSTDPREIQVNFKYLDHLAEAGLNWLVVFWTNSRQFDDAWQTASDHAHSMGLQLARGVYGFSGGGSEYTMAEPAAPSSLLRPSDAGPNTALCPHDAETQQWMKRMLADRLQPDLDGVVIEPAREIRRNCICERCSALSHYQWDTHVANFMTHQLLKLKPKLKVMLHLSAVGKNEQAKQTMARDLTELHESIRTIFAWGIDDDKSLTDWYAADPRFCAFTKIGRVILFPDGKTTQTAEARVSTLFRWCRRAADQGKRGYMFDWRIFGGTEWKGHEKEPPTTRISNKLPASIALMGAALQEPLLDEQQQGQLLAELRSTTDWDLDDPAVFYRGKT